MVEWTRRADVTWMRSGTVAAPRVDAVQISPVIRLPPFLRQLALNNLVLVLQYGVGSLVPLLLVPHIVRHIGLSAFGGLAIALAAASFGTVVVQFAFQLTGPRQLTLRAPGETVADVLCRVASAKLVLLAGVLSVVAAVVGLAAWWNHPVSGPQLWLLVALPLATALHTGWHLQTVGRFATVSGLSISGAVLALAIGLTTVKDPGSTAIAAAALALSVAPLWSGATTLWVSLRQIGRDSPPSRVGWRSPWGELREGSALFVSQFAAALYGASGPLLIGALAGTEQAGAFGAVERVSGAVVAACLLTHTAAYPKLVQLWSSDKRAYRRLLLAVVGAYMAVVGVLVLGVVAAWPQVLHFLLGEKGAAHGPLLASALAWIGLGVFGPVLTGYLTVSGQGGRTLALTSKVLACSLALGIPGVLFLGAWAWLAALCLSQTIVLLAAWQVWKDEEMSS